MLAYAYGDSWKQQPDQEGGGGEETFEVRIICTKKNAFISVRRKRFASDRQDHVSVAKKLLTISY